jgi:ElaB/YqjD/DUF883 family membrane-anchored ribosome-binding protein
MSKIKKSLRRILMDTRKSFNKLKDKYENEYIKAFEKAQKAGEKLPYDHIYITDWKNYLDQATLNTSINNPCEFYKKVKLILESAITRSNLVFKQKEELNKEGKELPDDAKVTYKKYSEIIEQLKNVIYYLKAICELNNIYKELEELVNDFNDKSSKEKNNKKKE